MVPEENTPQVGSCNHQQSSCTLRGRLSNAHDYIPIILTAFEDGCNPDKSFAQNALPFQQYQTASGTLLPLANGELLWIGTL